LHPRNSKHWSISFCSKG